MWPQRGRDQLVKNQGPYVARATSPGLDTENGFYWVWNRG